MPSVLIDGFALSSGSGARGIGTFLKQLITGLGERPDLSVGVIAEPALTLPDGAHLVASRSRAPRRWRALEHDLVLPARLRRTDFDVFHSPAQDPPRRSPRPWVQTLHDVTPLTLPHPLIEAERRRWTRLAPRLRSASAVVAVSRFSADQGIRHLDLDPRLVTVIHNGVDHRTFHPGEPPAADQPYLLHVAAWGPHKGFGEALAVIARLADRGLPHRLVMAGPQDQWMQAQVRAAVAASARPDRVEVAGYVSDLAAAYRGAAALLMTSRCEGFGFPALEAMACATPVVAFANSSLPEVVGDGGVLVADGDVDAMATAVERVIRNPALARELSQRGIAQAARFSWEETVEAYAELFGTLAR